MKTLVPERSDNFMSYNGQISNSIPSSPSPFLYAGQLYDKTSGLYYLRARWYDPKTAQFLSVDPLVAKTLQPYEYAGDNPVNAGDPSGECGQCATLNAIAKFLIQASIMPSAFDVLTSFGLSLASLGIESIVPTTMIFSSFGAILLLNQITATIIAAIVLARISEVC